jgi:hypothetical protein
MDKVSEKLSALVESQAPEEEVRLNVMLRRGLDRASVATLADEFAGLAPGGASVEVLPTSGIIMIKGTLGAVEHIASHPAVEWVDQDTESPVEDLLDS